MLLTVPTLLLTGIVIIMIVGFCLAILLVMAARAKARRDEIAEMNDPSIPENK